MGAELRLKRLRHEIGWLFLLRHKQIIKVGVGLEALDEVVDGAAGDAEERLGLRHGPQRRDKTAGGGVDGCHDALDVRLGSRDVDVVIEQEGGIDGGQLAGVAGALEASLLDGLEHLGRVEPEPSGHNRRLSHTFEQDVALAGLVYTHRRSEMSENDGAGAHFAFIGAAARCDWRAAIRQGATRMASTVIGWPLNFEAKHDRLTRHVAGCGDQARREWHFLIWTPKANLHALATARR